MCNFTNTICEYIFKQDPDPYCWGSRKQEWRQPLHPKKTGKKDLFFLSRLCECLCW